MPRPVHFEINANNPESVISFYSNVFGWASQKWDGPTEYWLIDTGEGEGISGGLLKMPEGGCPGVINTIDVDSIDTYVEKVRESGGKIAVEKMAVPGVGWLAYFEDPEGNVFGMMQNDTAAA